MEAGDPKSTVQLQAIKDKLAKGQPLDEADFTDLKSGLADHFDQQRKNGAYKGTDPATMDRFINDNDALKSTFADNHMTIDGVDRVGGPSGVSDGRAEHAILTIHDEHGKPTMVYDPNPRRASSTDRDGCGTQIVQDPETLADYEQIRTDTVKARAPGETINYQ
jgi:hypothetical protein